MFQHCSDNPPFVLVRLRLCADRRVGVIMHNLLDTPDYSGEYNIGCIIIGPGEGPTTIGIMVYHRQLWNLFAIVHYKVGGWVSGWVSG